MPYLIFFNRLLLLLCITALFSCASAQSRKLKALAKIDPKLAQKYKDGEEPAFVRHNNKNYVWDIKSSQYKDTSVKGKIIKKAPPKEIAKKPPLPLSPKLQSLKKIAPALARKYQEQKKEPPYALKYNSKIYLWDNDTKEYRSSKKKLSLKAKPKAVPDSASNLDTVKPEKPGGGLKAAPLASIPVPLPVPLLQVAPVIAKPKPIKKPKPVKKKTIQPPSNSFNIRSSLAKRLGPHKASALIAIIDRRVKKYSIQQRSDVTSFLVRSYQRYYRKGKLSPKQAIELMQKGLAHPGSLEAIVRNMKREFPEEPIRNYSFSKIFHITRSQARLLFSRNAALL